MGLALRSWVLPATSTPLSLSRIDPRVAQYMTTPLFTATPDESLQRVRARLTRRGISSLPVVEQDQLIGVISRSDLMRATRPDRPVRDAMTRTLVTVDLDAPLSAAAARMLTYRLHSVYVVDRGLPIGVLSPRGVVAAVRDAGCSAPIATIMSTPVLAISHQQPVAAAVKRIASEGVRGLVVVDDDDRPVGIFTQAEALAAWAVPASTPVEELMEPIACVSTHTTLHTAATRFLALRARGVLAVDHGEIQGFVTGVDFARHLAAHPLVSLVDPSGDRQPIGAWRA